MQGWLRKKGEIGKGKAQAYCVAARFAACMCVCASLGFPFLGHFPLLVFMIGPLTPRKRTPSVRTSVAKLNATKKRLGFDWILPFFSVCFCFLSFFFERSADRWNRWQRTDWDSLGPSLELHQMGVVGTARYRWQRTEIQNIILNLKRALV